jgi:hypothetical protein
MLVSIILGVGLSPAALTDTVAKTKTPDPCNKIQTEYLGGESSMNKRGCGISVGTIYGSDLKMLASDEVQYCHKVTTPNEANQRKDSEVLYNQLQALLERHRNIEAKLYLITQHNSDCSDPALLARSTSFRMRNELVRLVTQLNPGILKQTLINDMKGGLKW